MTSFLPIHRTIIRRWMKSLNEFCQMAGWLPMAGFYWNMIKGTIFQNIRIVCFQNRMVALLSVFLYFQVKIKKRNLDTLAIDSVRFSMDCSVFDGKPLD